MTRLLLTLILFYISTFAVNAQNSGSATLTTSAYQFTHWQEYEANYNVYIGYNGYYAVINYGLYEQLNAGVYYNRWLVDIAIRKHLAYPSVTYNYWVGNYVIRGYGSYNHFSGNTTRFTSSTSIGVGFGLYKPDYNIVSSFSKSFNGIDSYRLSAKYYKQLPLNFHHGTSLSVDNDLDVSSGLYIGWKDLSVGATYIENFENIGRNYIKFSASMRIEF